MTTTNEKVPFRLLQLPCCKTLICWVNPRLPSHCIECGKPILRELRSGEFILESHEAWLRIVRPETKDKKDADS